MLGLRSHQKRAGTHSRCYPQLCRRLFVWPGVVLPCFSFGLASCSTVDEVCSHTSRSTGSWSLQPCVLFHVELCPDIRPHLVMVRACPALLLPSVAAACLVRAYLCFVQDPSSVYKALRVRKGQACAGPLVPLLVAQAVWRRAEAQANIQLSCSWFRRHSTIATARRTTRRSAGQPLAARLCCRSSLAPAGAHHR